MEMNTRTRRGTAPVTPEVTAPTETQTPVVVIVEQPQGEPEPEVSATTRAEMEAGKRALAKE
jgi:hypothetical protein